MVNYLDSRRIMGTSSEKPYVFSTGCKAYYNAEDGTPTDSTLNSTDGTTGWVMTNAGSSISLDTGNNEVDFLLPTGYKSCYYDLGANISQSWVLRFATTWSGAGSNNPIYWIGVSNLANNVANVTGTTGAFIMFYGGSTYKISVPVNTRMDTSQNQQTLNPPTTCNATSYWVEIIKNGSTSITVSIYPNNSYTTPTATYTVNVDISSYNLRYLTGVTYDQGSGTTGTFSDVKFYDGVVVAPTAYTNKATTDNGFADGLGNTANGTNNGVTTTTGKLGSNAWSFDGTNDYIDIPDKFNDFTQAGSISCWIKPNTISDNDILFDNNNVTATNQGFMVRFETGALIRFGIFGATDTNVATATSTWTTGTWQHLVVTFDGTTGKIYKNGSEVASGSLTALTQTPTYNLRIGWGASGNDNKYDGDMDEVAIFNRALTADEVSTLYNSGTGLAIPTDNPNVETNSIFVETDTATRYLFNGTDWSPKQLMVATGGTITTDGNYKIHTFTSSGTFTVTQLGDIGTADVLVVAGGGGGGNANNGWSGSGGGGAGGLIYQPNKTLAAQAYTVTIGSGGAGGSSTSTAGGAVGGDSVFGSLTAKGGGGGAAGVNSTQGADAGGSGGGGTYNATTGGSGTQPSQSGDSGTFGFGNKGGDSSSAQGAGGGGAGAAGVNAGGNTQPATNGGIGREYSISGTPTFYAGGGGGGKYSNSGSDVGGSGGLGGGGRGSSYLTDNNEAGVANTGGGGGGGSTNGNTTGEAGGSGIVIVRYKYQ